MPNWCEGTLKVRGKNSDLIRFLIGACCFTMSKEKHTVLFDINVEDFQHIKGTKRGFVTPGQLFYCSFEGDDDIDQIINFRYAQAWDILAGDLKKLSAAYNIDFKIFACESGCQFSRDIEVIQGRILKNEVIKYEDYFWECPNPDYGG